MSEALGKGIDLARHVRLLRRALGGAAVACCDAAGSPLCADPEDGPLGALLRELCAQGAEPFALAGESGRISLDAGRTLVFAPIVGGAARLEGWLVALLEGSADSTGRPEQIVLDVACAIADELRTRDEIRGLTDDLSARHEELNVLYSLQHLPGSFARGAGAARDLLRSFTNTLDVDLAAFVTRDKPGLIYTLRSGSAFSSSDLLLTALRGKLFPYVTLARKPVVLNESSDVRREYFFVNLPYRVMACPVEYEGRCDAMLALVRTQDRPLFSNGDRNLAMVIAAQTALILANHRVVGELRRFGEQLVGALIQAVEAKDPYTRGHSERVQEVATAIGKGAALPAVDVEQISWGALLHDVGKIAIPDRILCKVGRLTEEEYTLVQIHPEHSYDILRHIEYIGPRALDAARFHQERFDGTGYPLGLRGAEIPVHARVTAVADTYDAVTSSRAYRPASNHETAMRIIAEAAGSQLDPVCVQVFERLCQDGMGWLRPRENAAEPDDP